MNKAEESPVLRAHTARLFLLRQRRAEMASGREHDDRNAATLKTGRAFVHTEKGVRCFVYPAFPDELDTQTQIDLCTTWIERELTSRGMVAELNLYADGPIFCCPTRRVTPEGFGGVVEEWGSLEFLARLQESFARAVNDALAMRGFPRTFTF